jgi:hypothetical protein
MVIAAGRAYQDLIRWIKAARPRTLNGWRLTRRFFGTSVLGAALLLGTIGLISPARFGSPTSRPRRGIEWWALAAVVAVCAAVLVIRRTRLLRGATRVQEALTGRELEQHPSFEPAVSALDSCPGPLRTRFTIGWVWGPPALAALGSICAASAVYFVIDAILARFTVGWGQAVLAVINAVLSLLIFRLAAKRLSVWRLSYAVNRSASHH